MNTSQKTSHFRTNLIIATGVVIILINLAWLSYRFVMQSKASLVANQIVQDENSDNVEPTGTNTDTPADTQQGDANNEDISSPDN